MTAGARVTLGAAARAVRAYGQRVGGVSGNLERIREALQSFDARRTGQVMIEWPEEVQSSHWCAHTVRQRTWNNGDRY